MNFYIKAKDTEREVSNSLESIKAQSDTLQKLTARWMDRFTRHATEPRPTDEGLLQLVNVVASLPTTILTHLEVIRTQPDASRQTLIQEYIDAYVALYYYTALANVLGQGWLPAEAEFDPTNNESHALIRGLIDRCAADFQYVARVLNGVDQTMVQSSRLQHLLQDAIQTWYPHVRFTSQVHEWRRTQTPAS
jgi:hypothetical protein